MDSMKPDAGAFPAGLETRPEALLDAVAEGVVAFDGAGLVVSANAPAGEVFGLRRGAVVGRSIEEFLGPGFLSRLSEFRDFAELAGRRGDGSEAPLEVAVRSIEPADLGLFVAVVRDLSDRKAAEARLRFQATRDTLTGLPNRNLFDESLDDAIRRCDARNGQFAVLFLDLDKFQTINDAFGHSVGDQVLRMVGERITARVKRHDVVARVSADEFNILLDEVVSGNEAEEVAKRMVGEMSRPFVVDGREIFTSASIGVVLYPRNAADKDELLRNADTAIHHAKRAGRSNYRFYTTELRDDVQRRVEIGNGLRRALENDEFTLFYQPKVELDTRRVIGAEALLRWRGAGLGPVAPDEFIPVAEETGLILPIGQWVLKTACREAAAWNAGDGPEVRVSVNLSALQFLYGDIVASVGAALEESGLASRLLDLELTESMLIENPDETIRLLNVLKDMGASVAMDDFGTGYSSLSYLTRFPLDSLKVDREFVTNLPHDKDATAIARAIVSMAQQLGLTVVAEGVETESQVGFLHALGCQVGQGYLFGPPVEAAAFREMIAGPD